MTMAVSSIAGGTGADSERGPNMSMCRRWRQCQYRRGGNQGPGGDEAKVKVKVKGGGGWRVEVEVKV